MKIETERKWEGFAVVFCVGNINNHPELVHGVYHPAHTGSTNGLILDYNYATWAMSQANPPAFNYSNGSLSAIQMRRY